MNCIRNHKFRDPFLLTLSRIEIQFLRYAHNYFEAAGIPKDTVTYSLITLVTSFASQRTHQYAASTLQIHKFHRIARILDPKLHAPRLSTHPACFLNQNSIKTHQRNHVYSNTRITSNHKSKSQPAYEKVELHYVSSRRAGHESDLSNFLSLPIRGFVL